METLYKKIGFSILFLLFFPLVCLSFQSLEYGEEAMNLNEMIRFNKLSAHEWVSENIIRNEKPLNINNINGEITMSFSIERERSMDSKQKKPFRKFKYSLGGTTHETNFTIIGDTIHFHGLKDWNDCKIIELSRKKLVLEQNYLNQSIFWNMVPVKRKKED
jgi:hypothetical protein